MTYRELIEFCHTTPDEKCWVCRYRKECNTFEDKTGVDIPGALYKFLYSKFDFDAEIEVEK